MDKLLLIREYLLQLKTWIHPGEERILFDNLNHGFCSLDRDELAIFVSKDIVKAFPDLSMENSCYMLSLVEYIAKRNEISPPEWLKQYDFMKMLEITFSPAIDIMLSVDPDSNVKNQQLEEALPEFLKRNLVVISVLDSL